MPMIPLLIGAGMGLLNASEKDKQASEDRKVAAATIAYSPYTGASIDKAQSSIHPAQYAASAAQGGLAGLQYAQSNAANAAPNASPQQMGQMQSAYKQIQGNMGPAPQAQAGVGADASGPWSPNNPYWRAMNPNGGS